jgi:hypothetical protein
MGIVTDSKRLVPLWLKIGFTVWVAAWTVVYPQYELRHQHFLWMCHIGLYLMTAGLWLESPLIMSWQAVSLLLADIIWTIDLFSGLAFGVFPFGATTYMLSPEMPLLQRLISLFHVAVPPILIWSLWRLGYDRRALWAQLATSWSIFPLSYLLGNARDNINWVYGPFGSAQTWMPPVAFLFVAMVLYPLVVYLPTHLLLRALVSRPRKDPTIKA